ncbi:DNA adenine methylase [Curtobacterium poinsettiae]|uniref:DNA adenine methylase n=1 Tax=Curtobacterium poinsettiae TaxID=159612 RepID=UPI0039A133FA
MGPARSTTPFLRWAGSKRWLVPHIQGIIPTAFGTYHEPFLGSGAVFFGASDDAADAVLNDKIPGLINTFRSVRDAPGEVHDLLRRWPVHSESYYRIRASEPPPRSLEEAARFIYLNRFGFNGLYRENASGQFNVPFGRPKNDSVIPLSVLESASVALQRAELISGDFYSALERVRKNDFVFLDPPYAAPRRRKGFTDYNATLFDWEDQRRLADRFKALSREGVHVVLVNAESTETRDLFKGFNITSVSRFSSISGKTLSRQVTHEIIVRSESLDRGI